MGANDSNGLLIAIVTALEEHGLDRNSYQLNNSIDVDALTRVVSSTDHKFEVVFTVEGYHVTVTEEEEVDVRTANP